MSERYIFRYKREQGPEFAEKEMQPIFKSIREGAGEGSEFEALIDSSLDKAMTRLRKGLPDLKEQDFVFLSYMIAGFSTPLVAKLMDMQKSDIHTKKYRLIKRIEGSDLQGKEELLRYIR